MLLHHILIKWAHLGVRLSRGPSRVQGGLSLLTIGGTSPEVLGITQGVVRLAISYMLLLLALETLADDQGVQIERFVCGGRVKFGGNGHGFFSEQIRHQTEQEVDHLPLFSNLRELLPSIF